MSSKVFVINEFITIKLEGGKTNIYVDGEIFKECKFLLLNITKDKVNSIEDIESIDDVAERLGWTYEGQIGLENKYSIPPETEFWGHCSNLQVWYEHNYDTRFLHKNIAFPLLKRLTDVGDKLAKRKFKEEIALRYKEGNVSVKFYLLEEGYIDYLTREEFLSILPSEYSILEGIEKDAGISFLPDFYNVYSRRSRDQMLWYAIKKDHITSVGIRNISLDERVWEKIFSKLALLEHLEILEISYTNLSTVPETLSELISLKDLILNHNNLNEMPNSLSHLHCLEYLCLSYNKFTIFPSAILSLEYLKKLKIENNQITSLSTNIYYLKSLELLIIDNNKLTTIPSTVVKLRNLQRLRVYKNQVDNVSSSLKNWKSLGSKVIMGVGSKTFTKKNTA